MRFKVFFVLYLFSSIFLTTSLFSFVLTPRQVLAVIMFIICLIEDKKVYSDFYWFLYLGFIVFYGLSSAFTGYFAQFIMRLVGDFFVAYVACWATKILVVKYNGTAFLLKVLAVFGCLDAIITIGQVYNWPYVTTFVRLLNLDIYASYYNALEAGLDMTKAVIPGLFRSGVMNGHFLMVVSICASIFLFNGKHWVFGGAGLLLILVASYLTQQRSGFFVAVAFTIILLYRMQKVKKSKNRALIYVALTVILPIIGLLIWQRIGFAESRYTEQGLSFTGRETIYATAIQFYKNNLFFGGFHKFTHEYDMYPHNFFLNAMITGGLFGGTLIIYMVIKQMKYLIVKLNTKCKNDTLCWILGFSFVATIIDSMVHNISLVNGDILAWIAWTCFYSYSKIISNSCNCKLYEKNLVYN